MRFRSLIIASVATLAAANFGYSADPPKKGGPPDIGGLLKIIPVMAALDADRDGSISAKELENAVAALKKIDMNSDGVLSPDELRPNMRDLAALRGSGGPGDMLRDKAGPLGPQMMARMFQDRDANGDGKLSGDEIPERMLANLERMDTNGDGAIDKSEMQTAASKMSGGFGKAKQGIEQGGAGVKPKRPE